MAETRLGNSQAFAHIGEAALRRDRQQRIWRAENGFGGAEKLNGPAPAALLHAKEPKPAKHLVALEHRGIDRGEDRAIREELSLQHQADERVPPRGVIGVEDQRESACVRRQAGARHAQRVKVAADVAARIPGEPAEQRSRDSGQVVARGV